MTYHNIPVNKNKHVPPSHRCAAAVHASERCRPPKHDKAPGAAGDFLEDHPTVHGISERNWGLVHPSMGKCHEDWDLLTITRVINPGYQWSSRVINQAY
jgi:hypothetical protein